jgi:hypothetical protein
VVAVRDDTREDAAASLASGGTCGGHSPELQQPQGARVLEWEARVGYAAGLEPTLAWLHVEGHRIDLSRESRSAVALTVPNRAAAGGLRRCDD